MIILVWFRHLPDSDRLVSWSRLECARPLRHAPLSISNHFSWAESSIFFHPKYSILKAILPLNLWDGKGYFTVFGRIELGGCSWLGVLSHDDVDDDDDDMFSWDFEILIYLKYDFIKKKGFVFNEFQSRQFNLKLPFFIDVIFHKLEQKAFSLILISFFVRESHS